MRTLRVARLLALALLAVAVPACHNDGPFSITIYVDPAFGDDFFGHGTPGSPLRTITRAMHFAIADDAIFLAPGTYSAASGELFPIFVKPGVILQGDPGTKGVGPVATFVNGAGSYTVSGGTQASTVVNATFVMGSGADVSGVKITAPGATGVGVVFDGFSARLIQCTVSGCGASGLRIYQTGSPTITNNAITANAASGVDVFDAASPMLRQNTITSNTVDGVVANDTSAPNLGDATTAGANTLQANTGVGLNNN